jgi:7-cyano-7-deazaguanine synthase
VFNWPIPTTWDSVPPPPQEPSVLLFSGGLDSTPLFVWLCTHRVPVHAFFIRYGQKSERGELGAVRHFTDKYHMPLTVFECSLDELISCSITRGGPDNPTNDIGLFVMEGRNLALLSMGVMFACGLGMSHLYVGYNLDPPDRPFPDCTIESWKVFQALCDVSLRVPMTIHAPFIGLTHLDILRGGLALDPDIAEHAFTCYMGYDLPCGHCDHCLRRESMLTELGVKA